VYSVKYDSPADRVGIKAGDIINSMEGLVLAMDGTMTDYCDILRSRDASDVTPIQVLRPATKEVLTGWLNSNPLKHSFSVTQGAEAESGGAATDVNFVGIYDYANALYVEVPEDWSDVDGSNWIASEDETLRGSSLLASPNISGFKSDLATPGVGILASAELGGQDMATLVGAFDFSADCNRVGQYRYEDGVYNGVYDRYHCISRGSHILVLAAEPADQTYAVVVLIQTAETEQEVVDHILNTFNVIDTLPGSS
jgi:serine protease Do